MSRGVGEWICATLQLMPWGGTRRQRSRSQWAQKMRNYAAAVKAYECIKQNHLAKYTMHCVSHRISNGVLSELCANPPEGIPGGIPREGPCTKWLLVSMGSARYSYQRPWRSKRKKIKYSVDNCSEISRNSSGQRAWRKNMPMRQPRLWGTMVSVGVALLR